MPETPDARAFCESALPILKPLVTDGRGVALPGADSPVFANLGNGLLVGYLVDQGTCFHFVQERHLEAARLDRDRLHRHAVDNLAAKARASLAVRPYGNVFALLMDGNFESSLILLDALWDDTLAPLASGGFVAALPARDVLAVCDAASAAGVDELRRVVTRSGGADHPLTPLLWRRRGAAWTPLDD